MIHVLSYVVLVALMIVILVVPELLLVIADVMVSSLFLVVLLVLSPSLWFSSFLWSCAVFMGFLCSLVLISFSRVPCCPCDSLGSRCPCGSPS